MSFEQFSLHSSLLANIAQMGFTEPTEVQKQVIPMAMEGRDVSGLSRTGTGKTAAFLIPTIHRLASMPAEKIALCLAPTRELAQQIETEAKKLAADLDMKPTSIVGGMAYEDQIKAIQEGARVIAGTPGRVIDLFKSRQLDLSRVAVLVFDEADRMFDMGFIKDMHYLLGKIPQDRQILLFSATMNFTVLNMIFEYGANPTEFNVSRDQVTADNIQQVLYHVGDNEKPRALIGVIRKYLPEGKPMMVFVNYKERVPWVAELLSRNGIPASGLSSLMRQEKRNKIIQGFRNGRFRALVATDVASRGLDIDNIGLVVNYHLPEDAPTYVHRIGRTARAGKEGIAVSIASSEDAYSQIRVEEFLGKKIPVEWFEENDVPASVELPESRYLRDMDDDEDGGSEGRDDRGHRRDRGPRRDGRRDGRRDDRRDGRRGDRGPRPERELRPNRAPRGERDATPSEPSPEPITGSAQESAPATAESPSSHESHRHPRREERHREGSHHDRSGREGRRDGRREHRDHRREGRRDHREHHRDREPLPSAADMPNPLTGNPIIYDMATGKPKNRSESEMMAVMSRLSSDDRSAKGPAIFKKLGSKVTALFGSRK